MLTIEDSAIDEFIRRSLNQLYHSNQS